MGSAKTQAKWVWAHFLNVGGSPPPPFKGSVDKACLSFRIKGLPGGNWCLNFEGGACGIPNRVVLPACPPPTPGLSGTPGRRSPQAYPTCPSPPGNAAEIRWGVAVPGFPFLHRFVVPALLLVPASPAAPPAAVALAQRVTLQDGTVPRPPCSCLPHVTAPTPIGGGRSFFGRCGSFSRFWGGVRGLGVCCWVRRGRGAGLHG